MLLLILLFMLQLFPDEQSQTSIKRISRRTSHGFNLIQSHVIHDDERATSNNCKDARVCYTLPIPHAPQLFLRSVLFLVFNFEYSSYLGSSLKDLELLTLLTFVYNFFF